MEIKCPNCLKIFNPNEKDEKFLLKAIKKEQKFAMIECQECYKDIPVNPLNLLEIENKQKDEIINCPICKERFVVHIKNETEDFYGCGECGNVWDKIENIR